MSSSPPAAGKQVRPDDGNAAIRFHPQDFDASAKQVKGMQVANAGFIQAFARHGKVDRLFGLCTEVEDFEDFSRTVRAASGQVSPECVRLTAADHEGIAEAGTLFAPSCTIASHGWLRRRGSQRGYSICGLTHSISDERAMFALCDLLVAPLQPWDALICTSRSVRSAVERLWQQWGEYLGERLSSENIRPELQLPVIPLGVDCNVFPDRHGAVAARTDWRRRLGVGDDDCVFLFSGRLSYHSKANPTPMYQALQTAATQTGRIIHLVHYGWSASERLQGEFEESARALCPSVRSHFVPGDGPEAGPTSGILYAADVFTSLSDNIQESFGLTPLEAMAAGLPVVVSDWDGYRDTVRHGRDGFTVPTLAPGPAMGADLADFYDSFYEEGTKQQNAYGAYIGNVSLATSVDTAACSRAYITLIEERTTRARFGESGQRRAREVYDWKHIIKRYQDLWRALAETRRRPDIPERAPRRPGRSANASRLDPFTFFRSFPTRSLEVDDQVAAAVDDLQGAYQRVATLKMNAYGQLAVGQENTRRAVLALIADMQPCTVGDLLSRIAPGGHTLALRNIVWLAKLGLLRVGGHNEAGGSLNQ